MRITIEVPCIFMPIIRVKKQTNMRTTIFTLLIAATAAISTDLAMADTVEATNPEAGKAIASTQQTTDASNSEGISGTPRPDSKFTKLEVGMEMDRVQEIMGQAQCCSLSNFW